MTLSGDRDLTDRVIGLAIGVHRHLGPGILSLLTKNVCPSTFAKRASSTAAKCRSRSSTRMYGSIAANRIDNVVRQQLIIEIKAIERFVPVHKAQIITYLRLSGYKVGLLLNVNSVVLKDGMRRFVL
jgi:GxxExxY protein